MESKVSKNRKAINDGSDKERSYIVRKVVRCFFIATPLTTDQWKEEFGKYATIPSSSTVSEWKNETRNMSKYYKNKIIKILSEDSEVLKYQKDIRENIYKTFEIERCHKIFFKLENMPYHQFLKYMLNDIKMEELHDNTIEWNAIDFVDIMKLLGEKINKLYWKNEINASFDSLNNVLLVKYLNYTNGIEEEYLVQVYFYKGDNISKFCKKHVKSTDNSILSIVFTTKTIKNKEYLKILKEYHAMLLSIDAFDLEEIEKYELYIPNNKLDETTEAYLNKITEFMLQKVFEQNYIVLKEILSRNYGQSIVEKDHLISDAGIWKYKYPVRCALDFEKKLLEDMIKNIAKTSNKLRILDINLAGGLYGVRLCTRGQEVTCVDTAPGCLKKINEIVERCNINNASSSSIMENVVTGYMRPDNFNVLKNIDKKEQYELIIIGLGSASYINNLTGFLRKISALLTDDGRLLISVYNTNALYKDSLNMENADFIYETGNFRHRDARWGLFAKTYKCQEIQEIVGNQHRIDAVYSYPVISSVISETQDKRILEYLRKMDIKYVEEKAKNAFGDAKGMFNIICASKLTQKGIIQCFNETQNFIFNQKLEVQEISHEEIYSRNSMYKALKNQGIIIQKNFIKSVLLYDKKNRICFWVLLMLENDFRKEYLSEWYKQNDTEYKMTKHTIKLYREHQLAELRLASGSVSPFAYPCVKEIIENERKEKMVLLYDGDIEKSPSKHFFTYSGNVRKTWEIKKESLMGYIKEQGGLIILK